MPSNLRHRTFGTSLFFLAQERRLFVSSRSPLPSPFPPIQQADHTPLLTSPLPSQPGRCDAVVLADLEQVRSVSSPVRVSSSTLTINPALFPFLLQQCLYCVEAECPDSHMLTNAAGQLRTAAEFVAGSSRFSLPLSLCLRLVSSLLTTFLSFSLSFPPKQTTKSPGKLFSPLCPSSLPILARKLTSLSPPASLFRSFVSSSQCPLRPFPSQPSQSQHQRGAQKTQSCGRRSHGPFALGVGQELDRLLRSTFLFRSRLSSFVLFSFSALTPPF